jgi:hypothetical protein
LTPELHVFISALLQLHLKPLKFVSGAVHRGPVLFRLAGWAGAKFARKIVHAVRLGMLKPRLFFAADGSVEFRTAEVLSSPTVIPTLLFPRVKGWQKEIGAKRRPKRLFVRDRVEAPRDSPYSSGRSLHWMKSKNPQAPAVRREAEEDWGRWPKGVDNAPCNRFVSDGTKYAALLL